jgi:O-antigen/teichoic acid export membrane protein
LLRSITQVFSYSLVANAFGALATIVIIRMMSPVQFAEYSMVLAIISVLESTVVSAFNRIFIVGYGRFNIDKDMGAFFATQILVLTVIWISIWSFKSTTVVLYILALFLALALCSTEFLRSSYQRSLRFNRFSQVLLVRSVLVFVSVVVIVMFSGTHIQAWQAILAQALAAFAVAVPLIIKKKMLNNFFHLNKAFKIIRLIFAGEYTYLFVYLFVLAFFSQLSVFMLNMFSDKQNLATYGSAFRYYGFLIIALSSVKAVYIPVIQNAEAWTDINRIFRKHRNLILLSLPVFILGCLISVWFIPWIDQGKYPEAPIVFQILAMSALVSFIFSPHVTVLMKSERFLFLMVLIIIGFFLNVIINYLLIPNYGALGAACSTLIAYGFVNSGIFIYSRKILLFYSKS